MMKRFHSGILILLLLAIVLIVGRTAESRKTASAQEAESSNRQSRIASSKSSDATTSSSKSSNRTAREPTIREVWGEIIDPAEDCLFSMKDGKLRTWVPGSDTPHDMNPEINNPGSNDAPACCNLFLGTSPSK